MLTWIKKPIDLKEYDLLSCKSSVCTSLSSNHSDIDTIKSDFCRTSYCSNLVPEIM
jgi:hypothetical protein